ncbi:MULTISPECIES: hypothetical protein [unclassified Microcoleus]|uniref:hypothetical protein n=1 Tax=unclassified Microcoleus TaxID=2642155 RepID=UPI002FD144A8
MKTSVEFIPSLVSAVEFIIGIILLWRVSRDVLRILSTLHRRMTVLKALLIGLRGELRDVQKFLNMQHGYHARGTVNEIEEDLLKEYNNENTGF